VILALKILSLSRAELLPLQHNELPEKMRLWGKKKSHFLQNRTGGTDGAELLAGT